METSMRKVKTAAIALVLLMASLALIITVPVQPAGAQLAPEQPVVGPLPDGVTPDWTITTIAHVSVRPNPIGFGQPLLVNIWVSPPTAQAAGSEGGHKTLRGLNVTLTKPDASQVVIGPMSTYPSSSTWFEYVVDSVGIWKVKFDFPGIYFPAGQYYNGYIVTNTSGIYSDQSVYYKPSSDGPYEFVVQQELVGSWPASPLPTDYWTWPVHPVNREWPTILGNWPFPGPGGGDVWDALYPDTNIYMSDYKFAPYVQGPNSAHIVWKRQNDLAGLTGQLNGRTQDWGTTGHYPTIIYMGRCYEDAVSGIVDGLPQYVWRCYDLRTGEVYWDIPLPATYTVHPIWGTSVSIPEPTSIEYTGTSANLLLTSRGRLIKYEPDTGSMALNVSIAPLTSGTYYMNGYCLSVQDLGRDVPAAERYRLVKWTTLGSSPTLASRIVSNITWPWSSLGTVDYETGIAGNIYTVTPPPTGVGQYSYVMTASLTTGELLCNVSSGSEFVAWGNRLVDHGKFAVRFDDGIWRCYNVNTGDILWTGEQTTSPWGYFGTYNVNSYGGLLIMGQFDALVAWDWETGKIAWKYEYDAPFPYESPYTGSNGQGVFSWHTASYIADGKIYIYNGEHTATQPATRGWKLHCINVTTGEPIWNIMGSQSGMGDASRVFQGAIADGYLATSDGYTGYMYVFGKGKSATTVTAPDVSVPLGTALMLKGTVLDQSPAQPGTPCVSKDSMTTQMEYLHMQMPIGGIYGNATIMGVPVSLDAFDPNGNYIHIADVTTDGYSGTFGYAWTPEIEGEYTITATFMGDDSYGSSLATTYANVGPAPEEPPTPIEPAVQEDIDRAVDSLTPMFLGIIVAVAIAIVIGVVNLWALRKRA